MKRSKQIFAMLLLLGALATTTTGCYSTHQCQATKVGNHR